MNWERPIEGIWRPTGDKTQFLWKISMFPKYNVEKKQISQSTIRSRWTIKPKSQLTPCHTASSGNFQNFNCNERLQARISSNRSQCFKHPREVHQQNNLFKHFRLLIPLLPGK